MCCEIDVGDGDIVENHVAASYDEAADTQVDRATVEGVLRGECVDKKLNVVEAVRPLVDMRSGAHELGIGNGDAVFCQQRRPLHLGSGTAHGKQEGVVAVPKIQAVNDNAIWQTDLYASDVDPTGELF